MNLDDAERVWSIIRSGGAIMLALALLAFMLYRNAVGLLVFVRRVDCSQASKLAPDQSAKAAIRAFREKLAEIVKAQLTYAKVLIVAAPLLGLLGTVMGMLDTFKGIGSEAGIDTSRVVADGVKVALITTQTGLMIAIFGIFITQWIARAHSRKDLELIEAELDTLNTAIET